MRIWVIAENWPPRLGGIERYITEIASNLAKKGHEVTVFAPAGSTGLPGVSVVPSKFFWPIIRPNWFPFFIILALKSLHSKPDVVICGKALFEGRVARVLQLLRRIPYVVCTYGMEIATWSGEEKTAQQLTHVLQHASHCLVINNKTRQEIIQLGARKDRVSYMYPGIDADHLTLMSNANTLMQRMNIRSPFIMTVARLIPRKGIDDLIRAFASIPNKENLSLVVVGDGPERQNLESLAQSLHVPVHFTGKLSDEDVHALYSRALLFALTPKELPGDYEGFGIVYLEAAYFGLPTVGTNTGGVPASIEHQVTGILATPGDIESITQALLTLIQSPSMIASFGNAGRERALAGFQWEKSIDTLERILTSL